MGDAGGGYSGWKGKIGMARLSSLKPWLVLVLLVLAAFVVALTPAILIQPFRPQTQRALEVSYLLRRWSPGLTLTVLILVLAFVVWLWPVAHRWWRKALLVVGLLLTLAPAWFARQNHFEWMFNPLAHSDYSRISDAGFAADSDMVLAVKINNEAVAYPVRLLAYHHLVQDVVGGTPLVATY